MNFLSEYIIPSAVCIFLLYAVYLLILRSETFFGINRFYLLGSVIFSVIFPFIRIGMNAPGGSGPGAVLLNTITVSQEEIRNLFPDDSPLLSMIIMVYLAGVVLFSLLFLLKILRIFLLVKSSGLPMRRGEKIIMTGNELPVISFFRFIFVPEGLKNSVEIKKILEHEMVHVRQMHSADVLLVELLLIIQWFNPAVWMLRKSVRLTHEYLADKGVLEAEDENEDKILSYCELLLSTTCQGRINTVINQFNYSPLKNRIIMITKKPSGTFSGLKTLLALPVIAGLFLFFPSGIRTSMGLVSHSASVSDHFVSGKDTVKSKSKDKAYAVVAVQPEFPDGSEAMVQYLSSAIKYPAETKKNNITGKVFVSFIVDKKGKITHVKVKKSANPLLDKEAVRVVASMPDWTPGRDKDGNPVAVDYVLPIKFVLAKDKK